MPTRATHPAPSLCSAPEGTEDRATVSPPLPATSRAWLQLAITSLIVAGLLSITVVVGRLPLFAHWINDAHFFKRCLVVHVDLALILWFYACLASIDAIRTATPTATARYLPVWITCAGVGLMLVTALLPDAVPILANYVPVIDHPVFFLGLALVFSGLAMHLLPNLLRPSTGSLPVDASIGIRAACLAFLFALVTLLAAWAGMPEVHDPYIRYETLMWGFGHVLQCVNLCAALAVWCWLVHELTATSLLSRKAAILLFSLLIVPHAAGPLLTVNGTLNSTYIEGFTFLMRWTLFPVATLMAVRVIHHLRRFPVRQACPRSGLIRTGLLASMSLLALGFGIGFLIRGSNTLIPAHYHASLGAITAAFMTVAYLLASRHAPRTSLARYWTLGNLQLALFGIGQSVFVAGFAIGGCFGLGRKSYANEQVVHHTGETIGLIVMGIGGLIAIIAGMLFLILIVKSIIGSVRWSTSEPELPITQLHT